jgi:PEGA domain-containing protein
MDDPMRALIVVLIGLLTIPAFAANDRDRDGISDANDRCPDEPEDRDGFQDADGCPDPDNDADGVADVTDKCPNEPEDRDGFQDDDGCPDPDNDQDGVPDTADKCPNAQETRNGFQDDDGCPDVAPNGGGKSPNQVASEGTLDISSSPAAEVTIDGKAYGKTPLRGIKLPAGTHKVVLRSGKLSRTKTVEIQAGKTMNLNVSLD